MWRLASIKAENLCAFRQLDYTLHQGVTTLIFGDNRDNDSQQSNGAGKSALLECIAVGITGSPLRKIRTEEIINDAAEECSITLHLTNDGIKEAFLIRRRIPRKGSSTVACTLWRDGKEVDTDEAVQPSVDAYNRYILDKLGITREELLNNFILSKYRYEDFLSSSDKEKKEIINRFSNGILVDEAIAHVDGDIEPLEEERQKVTLELAGVDGRVEMLLEQIRKQEEESEAHVRSKRERLAALESSITSRREEIRRLNGIVSTASAQAEEIRRVDELLQELESGESSLEECLARIDEWMPMFPNARRTDWNQQIESRKEDLLIARAQLANLDAALVKAGQELKEKEAAYNRFKSEYGSFCELYETRSGEIVRRLQELDSDLGDLAERMEQLRRKRKVISAGIDELSNKLAGSISCPRCGHEFLVAEPGFDIQAGMKELKLRQSNLSEIISRIENQQKETDAAELQQARLGNDKRMMESERNDWEQRLSEHERAIRLATRSVEEADYSRRRTTADITALQNEIESIRRKVFDEAFGLIDERQNAIKREIRKASEEIHAAECAIDTLQSTIREMESTSPEDLLHSLKESLEKEKKRSLAVAGQKLALDEKVRTLVVQKERFVQFKTYLANSKVEALSRITNEFLQNIGSDIRIRFDGYTVLKSGKVREKISISLLRDGVDCGSFGKFSAGEAARVNLATILAMQKLVNCNCEDGKGLDMLVLDEILEAVDEAGLAAMFEALNALGGTVLVVSHGNVAEGYPHKLVITKENGESRIGE